MNRCFAFATLAVALVLGSAGSANAFFGLCGSGCGCGCEKSCACEQACGCEKSCGCEQSCGCENSCCNSCCQRRCCLSGLVRQPPWHVLVPQELLLRSFLRLREELRLRAKLWLRKELRLREELWLRTELRLRIELLQFMLLPTSLLLERSLRQPPWHVLLPQELLLLRSQLCLRAELRLLEQRLRLRLRQVSLLCRVRRPAHNSTVRRTSAQTKK